MAERPVFIARKDGETLVETRMVEFHWHPGMAVSQKQKSIASLHEAVRTATGVTRVLEISSKSPETTGVAMSAFNLAIQTQKGRTFSVECAFQASKVFEAGGPFLDILDGTSLDAKRDARLQNSGRLLGFRFFGRDWPLEPQTAFYDWLYVNALRKVPELAEAARSFGAFTDIESGLFGRVVRGVGCPGLARPGGGSGQLPEPREAGPDSERTRGHGPTTAPRHAPVKMAATPARARRRCGPAPVAR